MPNPNFTEQAQLDLGVVSAGASVDEVVEGRFDGGSMTSDAGVLLLSAADRGLGLLQRAAQCIADPRNPLLITMPFATCCGNGVRFGVGVGRPQ